MILDGSIVLAGTVSVNSGIVGQLVTSVGATLGTNTVDVFGAKGTAQPADLGQGHDLDVSITILNTLTAAGAATVSFELVQADDVNLSTNLQVLASTSPKPFSAFVAKTSVPMKFVSQVPHLPKRYIGIRTVIGTAALTNGTGWLFAAVALDAHTRVPVFTSGYTV